MKLDVKNLVFGAVGEIDTFDLALERFELADDLVATSLKGKIKLTRLDESILAQFEGEAKVETECDRCLSAFEMTLPFSQSYEYFLGGFREDENDLLVSKNFEIDLTEPIREEIVLALPVQKLCRKDCKGLCPHCGTNLSGEECNCKAENVESL